jgi:hypothetical protein
LSPTVLLAHGDGPDCEGGDFREHGVQLETDRAGRVERLTLQIGPADKSTLYAWKWKNDTYEPE